MARLGRALLDGARRRAVPDLLPRPARPRASARLSWVNAGHPAGLVVAGGAHQALAATGPPAGLLPDVALRGADAAVRGRRGAAAGDRRRDGGARRRRPDRRTPRASGLAQARLGRAGDLRAGDAPRARRPGAPAPERTARTTAPWWSSLSRRRSVVAELDPEALGHAVERAAVDSQHLGGAAAVALHLGQHVAQVALLELLEARQPGEERLLERGRALAEGGRQVGARRSSRRAPPPPAARACSRARGRCRASRGWRARRRRRA